MISTDFIKLYEELDNLNEANNKVTGRFDRPIARNGSWFGIDTKYSEAELAKMEQEKAEAEAAKDEQEKQKLITKYLDKIKTITTADEAHAFNRQYWRKADGLEYLPLVDAETFEPIYDTEAKQAAVDAMRNWVKTNWQDAEAERVARDEVNYLWHCRTEMGSSTPILVSRHFPKDADQAECVATLKELGKVELNKAAKEARAFGMEFNGTGKLIITYVPDPAYRKKEETVAEIQLTRKTK